MTFRLPWLRKMMHGEKTEIQFSNFYFGVEEETVWCICRKGDFVAYFDNILCGD